MRRFPLVALLFSGIALPACAQHGGAHGGFSGHAGSAPASSGFHASARPAPAFHPQGSPGTPRPSGYRPGFGSPLPQAARTRPEIRYGANPAHSAAPGAEQANRRSPYRPPYRPVRRPVYGGGIVYEALFGYPGSYPIYPYDYGYDSYDDGNGGSTAPYFTDPYNGYDPDYGYDPGAPLPADPGIPYVQRYDFAPATAPTPEAASMPTVTLVFRDGRPNQQIHNFLINNTTLTVWDRYPHDIPIDLLDVPATERINHTAGVDLFLPPVSQ